MRLLSLGVCLLSAAQLASAAVQVNFTATLVTVGGNPFGLSSNDRLRKLTGYFRYDTGVSDSDSRVGYAEYKLFLSDSGFKATLGGGSPMTFTGTNTPVIRITNTTSGDGFQFSDGVDLTHPSRYMRVNGTADTDTNLYFYIGTQSQDIIHSEALPTTFGWGPGQGFPHTFAISDGNNGSLLFQLDSVNLETGTTAQGLVFVPVPPCRLLDTRPSFTLAAGETRVFQPQGSGCGVPSNARAYSLNVTVVPKGPLAYLTVYPAGQQQPNVSTLNSLDGRIKANAAIVPAGTAGAINVFATNPTDLVLDVNGYFVESSPNGLYFFPLPPCRIMDTRNATGSLGGPALVSQGTRAVPVLSAGCGVPFLAQSYSLNATVVPDGPFAYLSLWPTGTARPNVSTLNALTGTVVANAAIVPAGTDGAIDVYATSSTHFVLDVNGYFAPAMGIGELRFFPINPCRLSDSRTVEPPYGGLALNGSESRDYTVPGVCGIPATAQAVSLNTTVVPTLALPYLTLFPAGQPLPTVSTLNALDGSITSNAAIVPLGIGGAIRAFVPAQTHVIFDINGYFAP